MHNRFINGLIAAGMFFISSAASAEEDASAPVRDLIATCAACHGEKGASTQGQYPILAGQEEYYLYVQLRDFNSGLRADPVMGPVAAALTKEQMQLLAKYFSSQPWPETSYAVTDTQAKAARLAITAGECVACHLGSFKGNSRIPRLAGQHPEYLAKTMLDFKARKRMNAPDIAALISTFEEEELKALAAYLAAYKGQ